MPDEPVYFAFAGGLKHGPLSGTELEGLARRGVVAPDDLVWKSGTPEWVKAATCIDFSSPFPEAEEALLLESSGIRPLPAPPPPSPRPPSPPPPHAAGTPGTPGSEGPPAPPPGPGPKAAARRFLDDLRSLSLAEVVPVARLFEPETLGSPSAILLLVLGLGPLALGTVVEDPAVRIRLFHLALGSVWALFLVLAFAPRRPAAWPGAAVSLSTALFGVLVVTLLAGVPPLSWLNGLSGPVRALPTALLEEAGKTLILFFLARRLGGLSGPVGGLSLGLVAGLGFGLWEAIASTAWASPRDAAITFSTGSLSEGLYAFVVSSVVTTAALPLLHAAWSGVAGYAAGLASLPGRKTAPLLFAGIAVATLLHGLYAVFLSAGWGLLTLLAAAASLFLLLACRTAAERLEPAPEEALPDAGND